MTNKSARWASLSIFLLIMTGNVACQKPLPAKPARPIGEQATTGVTNGGTAALAKAGQVAPIAAEQIAPRCDDLSKKLGPKLDTLIKAVKDKPTLENTIEALDGAIADFEEAKAQILIQQVAGATEDARSKARDCSATLREALETQLARSELRDFVDRAPQAPTGSDEQQLLKALKARMADAGSGLPEASQKQLREKRRALEALEKSYEKNLAAPAGSLGKLETLATSAERRELYLKLRSRGAEANSKLLPELLRTRQEIARLQGKRSWADLVTGTALRQDSAAVASSLNELKSLLSKQLETDLVELQRFNRKADPASKELGPWDVEYVLARYRKEVLQADPAQAMAALKREQVFQSVLTAFGQSMGLKIDEIRDAQAKDPQGWATGVRQYSVAAGKDPIATFYADVGTRAGMPAGISVIPLRWHRQGKTAHAAAAVLVANLPDALKLGDVSRLIHETAHLMQHLLYNGKFAALSGLSSGIALREIPAKALQNWALEAEVLKLVMPALSADQAAALAKARSFGRSYSLMREVYAGLYDLALHGEKSDADPVKLANELYKDCFEQEAGLTALPAIPRLDGTLWASAWSDGYGAAAYEPFSGHPLEAGTGARFRDRVLAPAQGDPVGLLKEFLEGSVSPWQSLLRLLTRAGQKP